MEQSYLNKVKALSYIKSANFQGKNIEAISDETEKHQIAWNVVCAIYDESFTKHINLITIL